MKILCLHGFGSSGAIFEAQMANLQQELDPSIELIFVDGPFECERGPGTYTYSCLNVLFNVCVQASRHGRAVRSFLTHRAILLF